jgi:glycosyl hydrolase family 10/concanavalin A-like lectin/glucanase superfamily protein
VRHQPYLATISLLFVLLLLQCNFSYAGESSVVERLTPSGEDVPARLTLRGTAQVLNGKTERGLQLPKDAYAEWNRQQALTTDAGTLSVWVKPLWPSGDQQSHTFATFKWSGSDQSYFALSQGWWEPQGRGKLYVVLSNQQQVFCFMPWTFDYTLYLQNQWTMLGVTWQSGNPGYVRLFVDGKAICERKLAFAGGRHALDPMYLGSDRGSGIGPMGRSSDMTIKDILTVPRPWSVDEMRRAYARGGGSDRPKWILALASKDPPVDVTRERRVMQDEDTRWASSKLEMQRRISRIKAAGFNVYMPCVWDGAHAFYAAGNAPTAHTVRDALDPQYDPLAYLIAIAHREGIAVHPWFVVAGRPPESDLPESYSIGGPSGAYNVHSAEFRDFIVALVVDVARRYDVDGINLDYVRAIGPCSNKECLDSYTRKYGRSLLQDWKSQEQGETIPSLIEWNRSAMTDIVVRISSGTRKLKPSTVLTIDTVPFDHSRQHQGLDEENWLHAGLIDALVDMTYDDPIDVATVDRAMKAFTPARQVVLVRDYDWFGDTWVDRSGNVMADYIRLIRTRWPGAGIGFYHYPHLSSGQIILLGSDVFKQVAAPDWTH